MKKFQWRVCLCDDNPKDLSMLETRKNLEAAGFSVLQVSNRSEFLANADALSQCHVALIDMDWGRTFSDAEKDPQSIPDIGKLDPDSPQQFVAEWLDAIESWAHENASTSSNSTAWPQTAIGQKEVGAWIGALLSNVAPGIEIIFYSSKPGVVASGFAAALGRFRDAAYAVETKTESAPLPIETVIKYLKKLQIAALTRPDIHDWFLAEVLLPILLEEKSASKLLPEPQIHRSRRKLRQFEFESKTFFPGITQSVDGLRIFYGNERSDGLRRDAVSGLEHNLRPWNPNNAYTVEHEKLILKFTRLSQSISSAMPGQFGIAGAVWGAIASLRSKAEISEKTYNTCIRRAWELCWATLFEPSCFFQRIANESGGEYKNRCGLKTEFPEGEEEAKLRKYEAEGRKPFAVDLDGLERACGHLKDNGPGKLQIEETKTQITVSWISQWVAAADDNVHGGAFRRIVRASLMDSLGAHRGLPYVILFGLLNGAATMQVHLGGRWDVIFSRDPKAIGAPESTERIKDRFIFEWKFHKDQP